jgi:drug/metabolite transporter (DMT)-like permease
MKLSEKQKGILALIGLAFTYATFGFFSRFLSLSFDFFQQIYLRLFAGLVLGFLMFKNQIDLSKLKKISLKEWLLLIFRAFFYYLLGAVLFNKAVFLTKISTVAFIGSIPMTAILGFLILREPITFKKILYISLSFIGVIAISVNNFSDFSWGQGEMFALLSCFFCSLSIVSRKYQTKLLNNVEITQIILFIATVAVFITSLLIREGLPVSNWSTNIMFVVLAAGLVNVLMTFFTNYGFEKVKTSIASNILTLEMFFAILIGFVFYREFPNLKEMFGGALILFSVIQMNKLE